MSADVNLEQTVDKIFTITSRNVIEAVARQAFRARYYLWHSPSRPLFHPQEPRYQGGLTTMVRQDVQQGHLLSEKMEDAGGGSRRQIPPELPRAS